MKVLLALVAGLLTAQKDTTKDESKLQGTWVVVSAQREGKPYRDVKDAKLIFKDNMLIIRRPRDEDAKSTYRVDATKTPRTIDLTEDGRVSKGIYLLQGDVLKLCISAFSSKKRPDKFSAEKGEGTALIELKREKK